MNSKIVSASFILFFLSLSIGALALPTFTQQSATNNNTQYNPDISRTFFVNISDNAGSAFANITNVTFETNLTGTLTNFTSSSTPAISNNTTGFRNITFTQIQTAGAGTYVFRWIANNSTSNSPTGGIATTGNNVSVITINTTNVLNLYMNDNLNQNLTILSGQAVNITGINLISSSGSPQIYQGGNVSNITPNNNLSRYYSTNSGGWTILINTTGNANYSSNSSGILFYLIVNAETGGAGGGVSPFLPGPTPTPSPTIPPSIQPSGRIPFLSDIWDAILNFFNGMIGGQASNVIPPSLPSTPQVPSIDIGKVISDAVASVSNSLRSIGV